MKKKYAAILILSALAVFLSSCTSLNKEETIGEIAYKVSDKWDSLAEPSVTVYYTESGMRISADLDLYAADSKTIDVHIYDKACKPIDAFITETEVISDEIGSFSGSPARTLNIKGLIGGQPAECYCYGFYYNGKGYSFTFFRMNGLTSEDFKIINDLIASIKTAE